MRGTVVCCGQSFRRFDRGQVALEYLGFIPILIIVAMAAVQLGLIAYTAQQAGTAARTAARSASLDNPGWQQDGRDAVSDWVADGTGFQRTDTFGEVAVTAVVDIPSIVPGWDFDPARKTAIMPSD
ncbi:TadE/TadG family type IV pilus assembly protein [Streptomyces himalayensis]|uniref:Pilus assembly protein n=1 Tax=Streptomyces himalayensis subsp. himalayensis TaxID=2756131 RepID=A0A7W0DPY7_9ACTN|nr:TadE/TadG family type IV pilus assembly protein [Streptomyces himalayensis]MBA2949109.1 pilus assembly protein [Streptomyces himalayensis subsp. himalayensis]